MYTVKEFSDRLLKIVYKAIIWEVSSQYLEEKSVLILEDTNTKKNLKKQALLSSLHFFTVRSFPSVF
jgi:hypothetical protein